VKGNAHPWRGTGVPRLGCRAGKARRFVAHRCVRELQRSASERTGPGQMRASGQASDRDQARLVSAGRVTTRRSCSAHARRDHDTGSWPVPGFGSGRIGIGPAHGGAGQDTRQVTTATPAWLDFRATGATDEGWADAMSAGSRVSIGRGPSDGNRSEVSSWQCPSKRPARPTLGRAIDSESSTSMARNAAPPGCRACGPAVGSYSGRIKTSSRPVPHFP
jgi:hypothetical protein